MRRPDRTLLSVLLCVGLTLATPLPVAVGAEFAAAENHYRLTYTASSPRSLAVEAEIDVVGDALTMDWASASFLDEGWATFVCDLRAYGLDGAEVALSPEGAGRWRLDRALDRVRLSYTVRLEHDLIGWDEGGHDEAAYVLDDLIFFVGKAVFVTAG
ncbi:MAG: hypothetical protein O7A04_02350, partial [Acidobacteria bacterium]|nr:hypothetical protein [Acidobacteriota bacterium]